MKLGAFSVSLSVKNIALSRAFYEKLGFSQVAGDQAQNWLILRNGDTTIGLFQGMFPSNTDFDEPKLGAKARDITARLDWIFAS